MKLLWIGWILVASLSTVNARSLSSIRDTAGIDRIDVDQRIIVIGDVAYRIANNVVIFKTGSGVGTLQDLKSGETVGFQRSPSDGKISKIWVLR